jgi:diacylglycerol diphosphate phosphatase/phosphatidate phosphatase
VRRSFWDAHCGLLGLLLTLALSQTLTIFIKVCFFSTKQMILTKLQICVGRPRPDLFDRCQPPADYTENPVHGLTSWTICTRTDLLQDGFRSFPSGHASFSGAGMWYLILYSAASMSLLSCCRYGLTDRNGKRGSCSHLSLVESWSQSLDRWITGIMLPILSLDRSLVS